MDKTQALNILSQIDQEHLFVFFNQLSLKQQKDVLAQLNKLSITSFKEQQKLLQANIQPEERSLEPILDITFYKKEMGEEIGKQLIQEGKVGCLLLAGGQGTRLGFKGPKGCFPITRFRRKTLFQLFAEKVKAAGNQTKKPLFLAIMTSPQNHEETCQFFQKNHFFGLKQEQLFFFIQEELPLLDNNGNLFFEEEGKIAFGPNGNGMALHRFVESGLWDFWHHQGIRYLNTILIDNPLADPFDPSLIGLQKDASAEVVIKCTTRIDADENVGILVKKRNKTTVIEYSELSEKEKRAKNSQGELLYSLANLSLFSFHMDFVKFISNKTMPLHKAHKTTKKFKEQNETHAWKFETFIFDVIPFAHQVSILVYPREYCFAPLKNREGKNSLKTVQEALLSREREIFKEISGIEVSSEKIFELAQDFYYPSEELKNRWKGKPLPQENYIES